MLSIKTVSIYEPDPNNHYAVVCSEEGVFLVAQQKAYVYVCVLNVADEPLLLDFRVGGDNTWVSCISSLLLRLRLPKHPENNHAILKVQYADANLGPLTDVSDILYELMKSSKLPFWTYTKLSDVACVITHKNFTLFIATIDGTSYAYDALCNVYDSCGSYEKLLSRFITRNDIDDYKALPVKHKLKRKLINAMDPYFKG